MFLSAYEKKSLLRFLLIYLLSIYTFIVVLSYMVYTIEIKNLYESYNDKIRAFASLISNEVITSHMMGDEYLEACLKERNANDCFSHAEQGYSVSLYGTNLEVLYAGFSDTVDLNQTFYTQNDALFYIDDSTQLHLGVKYVVVKKDHLTYDVTSIQKEIIAYMVLGLILATLLGYVLAKLFLKPIKAEREALDRFIKDSTHELNTPITAILMSIETLKDIDPKKKKRIELSGKRIASLYANLSYMLLYDKQEEEKNIVDIQKLIEARCEHFHDIMMQKSLHISLELTEKSLHVNEESMVRLIDNLLSNAIKYNVHGGKITVVLTDKYLSVADNGIGIADDKLHDILLRYKRANNDRGGFGIGLDIVNTICQSNHFKLEITSQLNKGSTFTVWF